jgi:hypothetical protein
MRIRQLLAATIAAGLAFAPSVFAQDAITPARSKKISPKIHKKADKVPVKMRRNDNMMGNPYSTQKDEMTR